MIADVLVAMAIAGSWFVFGACWQRSRDRKRERWIARRMQAQIAHRVHERSGSHLVVSPPDGSAPFARGRA